VIDMVFSVLIAASCLALFFLIMWFFYCQACRQGYVEGYCDGADGKVPQ
jgi:hypothetical protein